MTVKGFAHLTATDSELWEDFLKTISKPGYELTEFDIWVLDYRHDENPNTPSLFWSSVRKAAQEVVKWPKWKKDHSNIF